MEEINKTVPIAEVVGVCKNFIEGKVSQTELQEWGTKIDIRVYIPSSEKMQILSEIILYNEYINTTDCSFETVQIEQMKFWKGLLRYTNIKVEDYEEETYYTDEIYDILYPVIGLWIQQFCAQDYQTLVNMVDNNFRIYWSKKAVEIFEEFDEDKLQEISKENEKMMKYVNKNKDTFNKMADLAFYNDPNMKNIGEAIKKTVIEKTKIASNETNTSVNNNK